MAKAKPNYVCIHVSTNVWAFCGIFLCILCLLRFSANETQDKMRILSLYKITLFNFSKMTVYVHVLYITQF